MKIMLCLISIAVALSISGCEKVSENAAKLTVDFSWQGMEPCGWGNPQINFSGIPEHTKYLQLHMYDHVYRHDHGKVELPYTGKDLIDRNQFKDIQGPCPPGSPGEYEITIKALDEKDIVIGIGSKTRFFPEEEK